VLATITRFFEAAVLGLAKNGAVSKPFLTGHGYHIVKRLNVTPVSTMLNAATKESLRMQVEQSDRTRLVRAALAQKAMSSPRFKKLPFSGAELQAYTDSVLSYQVPAVRITLQPTTALLQTGNHAVTGLRLDDICPGSPSEPTGCGLKPFNQLWNEFVQATAVTYYQDHLEEFNEEFRRQITEFAEGNLFFEIMQRQVWTPAQTDSAALVAYFEKHKEDYNWKESADAILFYGVDAKAAKEFYNAIHKSRPTGERSCSISRSRLQPILTALSWPSFRPAIREHWPKACLPPPLLIKKAILLPLPTCCSFILSLRLAILTRQKAW
jgi:peptidyl-prolyl cis-trans isomerase SurA